MLAEPLGSAEPRLKITGLFVICAFDIMNELVDCG